MARYQFYRGMMLLIGPILCGPLRIEAAPDLSAPLKQINATISALRNSSNNHEVEIREIQEKFASVEAIVDALRQQLTEYSKAQSEQRLTSNKTLEVKIGELELVTKNLMIDLQTIKNHMNDTTALLTQYMQQMQGFEKVSQIQNQNMENLQASVKALMELLQPSEEKDSAITIYQVKSGDTLEKIALAQKTSIKALKELNALTSDRIKVNQKLKIPSK
jgi:LysM repeat protein